MVGRRLLACPEGHVRSLGFTLPGNCYNCPEYLLRGRPAICLTGLKATWDAKAQNEPRNLAASNIWNVWNEAKKTAENEIKKMKQYLTNSIKKAVQGLMNGDIAELAANTLKRLIAGLVTSCGGELLSGSRCLIGNKTGCTRTEKDNGIKTPIWESEVMELEVSLPQQLCA